MQLQVRDAESADHDLAAMLAEVPGTVAAGALLFSCTGRGAALFGTADHDVLAVRDGLGTGGVAGFFAAGEIGPVGGPQPPARRSPPRCSRSSTRPADRRCGVSPHCGGRRAAGTLTGMSGAQPDAHLSPVTLDDIRAARELLEGVIRDTPVQGSRPLSERVGGPVWLKCENLQRAGSFKIRGAYIRIARLTEDEGAHGVVAASAGNHAQGVALAAPLLGHHGRPCSCRRARRSRRCRPPGRTAPRSGFHGTDVDEALLAAQAFADETGAVLIHPFDHPDIVAGQGTVGLEILEQCPDVRTVVVCTGGGGLLGGHRARGEGAAARRAGRRRAGRGRRGVPAVAGRGAPGARWTGCRRWPTASRSAGPAPCRSRIVQRPGRRHRHGLRGVAVAGPAAAASSGPSWSSSRPARPRSRRCSTTRARFEPPVVAVLSGGNIDPLLLLRVLRHGLAAAGRYLSLPGAHPRPAGRAGRSCSPRSPRPAPTCSRSSTSGPTRGCGSTRSRCALQLETRGAEHCAERARPAAGRRLPARASADPAYRRA